MWSLSDQTPPSWQRHQSSNEQTEGESRWPTSIHIKANVAKLNEAMATGPVLLFLVVPTELLALGRLNLVGKRAVAL